MCASTSGGSDVDRTLLGLGDDRNLDADEIYLELIDEMSPGVIRTTGSFLYVLMPMRVSQ